MTYEATNKTTYKLLFWGVFFLKALSSTNVPLSQPSPNPTGSPRPWCACCKGDGEGRPCSDSGHQTHVIFPEWAENRGGRGRQLLRRTIVRFVCVCVCVTDKGVNGREGTVTHAAWTFSSASLSSMDYCDSQRTPDCLLFLPQWSGLQ